MSGTDSQELQRYRQARRYFLYGQIAFFFALIVCILLMPRGLFVNHGFSFYGKHTLTIIPYQLAYIVSGACTFLSARHLPGYMPFRFIIICFLLTLPLLLGIIITSSSSSPHISHIHVGFGTSLFILQLVLVFWLTVIVRASYLSSAIFAFFIVTGVITLLSLLDVIPYLLEGQILFQLLFGVSVMREMGALQTELVRQNEV